MVSSDTLRDLVPFRRSYGIISEPVGFMHFHGQLCGVMKCGARTSCVVSLGNSRVLQSFRGHTGRLSSVSTAGHGIW